MIKNILATIFITLTGNTKIMNMPQRQINREANSNNYNLSFGNEQYSYTKVYVDSYRETSYRTYKLNINKKVINSSYLNAEEITINQYVASGNNILENGLITKQNINNPTAIDIVDTYNGDEAVYPGKYLHYSFCEQLKIIKIQPNNYNINTYWNLTTTTDLDGTYSNDPKTIMYNEMLSTIGDGLNSINITASSADDLWENIFKEGYTTCYRIFNQLRTNYSGYQSTYTRYLTDFEGEYLDTLENNFAIKITPNKTNYLILFRQPTIVSSITPEHNYGATGTSIWYTSADGEYQETTNNLSGTNLVPTGTQEVIDIPGVMFQVLGMPFSFISVAFNLTIFPGTAYEVNISTLFLSIFAVLIFVLIIKLLLKGFNK